MKSFIAHSENINKKVHLLHDHLFDTAELTSSYSPRKEFISLFYSTGLLHDIGKYQDGFQKYLVTGKPKTPHAGIGAYNAYRLAKEIIPLQFAIQGHHAGLPDNADRRNNIEDYEEEEETANLLRERFFGDFHEFKIAGNILPIKDKLLTECLTRFLFSALTDADWLDTEQHFKPELKESRTSDRLDKDNLCECLVSKLEKNFSRLPTQGKINELRTKARNDAITQAKTDTGFFSLQLPTGLGKTLTSMYWALRHAERNNLKRIIIVLPYINIIDQTAKTLKDVFGDAMVLEHHSGIVYEDKRQDTYDEAIENNTDRSKRLASENWDAPIIVTTSVQFFESLLSNRPSKCRKNHNIAESVVIFDEIQTLPKEYAEPIIVLLKNISTLARTSILFCTATQPAFYKRESFDGIENIHPLIKRPEIYFKSTRRVNYELLNKLDEVPLERIVENMKQEKGSLLTIVNTKNIAKELFNHVKQFKGYNQLYHLSTAMCPHHRKGTIAEIIQNLHDNKRIAVISTQLVEAGVDFDFPVVYRALAPMDSIIQAAGRCNRNGNIDKGKVVLFNLEKHKMPDKTYEACAGFAAGIIKEDVNVLHDVKTFEQYYEQVIRLFVNADTYKITELRKGFNFKTVSESFKIINQPTILLFIKDYSAESKKLLNDIENSFIITREQLRKVQQFGVQVYPTFLEKHKGQIEYYRDTFHIWLGAYDKETGLSPEDVETVF